MIRPPRDSWPCCAMLCHVSSLALAYRISSPWNADTRPRRPHGLPYIDVLVQFLNRALLTDERPATENNTENAPTELPPNLPRGSVNSIMALDNSHRERDDLSRGSTRRSATVIDSSFLDTRTLLRLPPTGLLGPWKIFTHTLFSKIRKSINYQYYPRCSSS